MSANLYPLVTQLNWNTQFVIPSCFKDILIIMRMNYLQMNVNALIIRMYSCRITNVKTISRPVIVNNLQIANACLWKEHTWYAVTFEFIGEGQTQNGFASVQPFNKVLFWHAVTYLDRCWRMHKSFSVNFIQQLDEMKLNDRSFRNSTSVYIRHS